jgi:ParB family chromosome partitioning protein
MVAYRLVDLVGRASAANILGISIRELDKLVTIFELSGRFDQLREPSAAITWARELMGLSKNLVTPSVVDAVVEKINQKRITNSKELRKLRVILRDPVAKAHFLSSEGDIESSMLRIASPTQKKKSVGLLSEIDSVMDAITKLPWMSLEELKGNEELVQKLDEAQELIRTLRKNLST